MILELQREEPQLFSPKAVDDLRQMLEEGVRQEVAWGQYVIGNEIPGLTGQQVSDYIHYLGNLRWNSLGMGQLYPEFAEEPADMAWVSQYSNANMVKTDSSRRARPRTQSQRPWWTTCRRLLRRRGRGALPRGAATRSRDECVSSRHTFAPEAVPRAGRYTFARRMYRPPRRGGYSRAALGLVAKR